MARTRSTGNGRLEEGMAQLQQSTLALNQSQAILNQSVAQLVQNQAAFLARANETDRAHAEDMRRIEERFTRIEATLAELIRLLHSMPDAVREKFGFRPPP